MHTYTLTGYKRTDATPSYPHPASGFPLSGMSAAGPPPSGGEEGLPSHDDSSGRLFGVHSLAWRLRVEARWRRTRYLRLAHNSFSQEITLPKRCLPHTLSSREAAAARTPVSKERSVEVSKCRTVEVRKSVRFLAAPLANEIRDN